MKYKTGGHCSYRCMYHLVLVTKYRRKVITQEIFNHLQEKFIAVASNHNAELVEMNFEGDHIHILFETMPHTNINKMLIGYKSSTSRQVKELFPTIREKLWKDAFWSGSYFIATTGEVSLDVLKKYVNNQKQI